MNSEWTMDWDFLVQHNVGSIEQALTVVNMSPHNTVLQVGMAPYYEVLPLLQSFSGTFLRKILSERSCSDLDLKEILGFKFSSNKLIDIRIPKQLIPTIKY